MIVGPTASGKTALSLEVARRLGDAEIISVDSMQVYRRMDIGTGKATADQQALVRHHLLDVAEPSDECSVGWFRDLAASVVDDLAARDTRAIFVGGTGLYHRVVVDRIELPGDHPKVRAALEEEVAAGAAPEALHRRLAELDPQAAARIEPSNLRRTIRALEVTVGSGRAFSSYGPGLETYAATDHLIVGLAVERSAIGPAIERRVAAMVDDGFLAEVESLVAEPDGLSRTARQALGYRELIAHIEGRATFDDAVADTILRTRRFAVRQERWFRRDPRVEWFGAPTSAAETAAVASVVAGRLVGT